MTLVLDVSGLEREVGRSEKFKLNGPVPEGVERPEGVNLGPISVEGRALWTGETVLVEGRAWTDGEFVCGRCLEPFTRPVEAGFAREFRPVEQDLPRLNRRRRAAEAVESDAAEEEAGDDQEAPLPFSDDKIDLSFPAWEALVLELPMKPVCREDCAGLCPVCGTNRNEKTCGCQESETDSRLLSLKKLLEAKERGE